MEYAVVITLDTGKTTPLVEDGIIKTFETIEQAEEQAKTTRILGHVNSWQQDSTKNGLLAISSVAVVDRSQYDYQLHDSLRYGSYDALNELKNYENQELRRNSWLVTPEKPRAALEIADKYLRLIPQKLPHNSQVYVWMEIICAQAVAAAYQNPLNLQASAETLPFPGMIYLFTEVQGDLATARDLVQEGQYQLYGQFGCAPWPDQPILDALRPITCILLLASPDGIRLTWFGHIFSPTGIVPYCPLTMVIPYGVHLPNTIEHFHLSVIEFLKSPYVTSTPVASTRSEVRRWERRKTETPSISIIRLRRELKPRTTDVNNHMDWKYRWWVTGHWRNQFLPSTRNHRPTWIAPYLKGPEERPLKQQIREVIR